MNIMKIENEGKRGRGRPRIADHEVALDKAMALFWQRGYEATSMSDLTAGMGMSPSSIYSTWGDKEGLFKAALARYANGPGSYPPGVLAEAPTARDAMRRLFERAAEELTVCGRPTGCLVALSGTQGSPAAAAVNEALADIRRQSGEAIEARLRQGLQAGELSSEAEVSELASFYSTVLYGMSIKARDGADREALLSIGRRALEAWPTPASA